MSALSEGCFFENTDPHKKKKKAIIKQRKQGNYKNKKNAQTLLFDYTLSF